ncbi:hypothetical protein P4O66_000814 [Electrophorus voltai]|uniref:Uncharacterized protein n=1 Tax=Electrophorus voltai TaxID=2609070 RepID=A0AAD9DXD0_9TELE|nr:hypothetical protein P4O66_000814 [Electrophorus voltai]
MGNTEMDKNYTEIDKKQRNVRATGNPIGFSMQAKCCNMVFYLFLDQYNVHDLQYANYQCRFLVQTRNPQLAVRRYKKIYRRGKSLCDAYKAVGVDRNTVMANAPIAELAILAPDQYTKLLEHYLQQEKLHVFAVKSADVLNNDMLLLTTVEMYKKKNKLLPLMKRK